MKNLEDENGDQEAETIDRLDSGALRPKSMKRAYQ